MHKIKLEEVQGNKVVEVISHKFTCLILVHNIKLEEVQGNKVVVVISHKFTCLILVHNIKRLLSLLNYHVYWDPVYRDIENIVIKYTYRTRG